MKMRVLSIVLIFIYTQQKYSKLINLILCSGAEGCSGGYEIWKYQINVAEECLGVYEIWTYHRIFAKITKESTYSINECICSLTTIKP